MNMRNKKNCTISCHDHNVDAFRNDDRYEMNIAEFQEENFEKILGTSFQGQYG